MIVHPPRSTTTHPAVSNTPLLRSSPARTKELAMACERFTSAQSLQWGFLNHVVPDAEVLGEARRLAERLLSMDLLTLAMTKQACAALENLMVPKEPTWSNADLMLLAHRQAALRRRHEDR